MEHLSKDHFISRDLSWLDFNARVLEEAADKSNPVAERLKFVAIFSNNLDEFFMVRVASLRQRVESGDRSADDCGLTAEEQLHEIRRKVIHLCERQQRILQDEILPELREKGVVILRPGEWGQAEAKEIKAIFDHQIFPALTPLAVDPSHPFPVLNNKAIQLAVSVRRHDSGKIVQAFVEVPEVLPRFIKIRSAHPKTSSVYVLLEDMITCNIGALFSKCEITEVLQFRINRDMEFTLDEEDAADLISEIRKELLQQRRQQIIRMEVLKKGGARTKLENWLCRQIRLENNKIYNVDGMLHLANFFQLAAKEGRPELTEAPWPPLRNPQIRDGESVFSAVKREGAIPVFLPFQSFDPVVKLLEEASADPSVLAIKQTLYRVSGDSPVVKALQSAAENKKQVTVIVEVKARFDEEHNILWAHRLEESGAHVIYGIPGLKIHGKALLIIRREEGMIRRYLHLSTGNYNDKTARIYTDAGLITDDPDLCSDIASLFNVMTGYSAKPDQWLKIAAAPFDLKEKFISLIDREIRLSSKHMPGRIIAKMNSLVDRDMIEHIYKAAEAGVEIDLIVRGICCLKPGIRTGNIRVTSIVDRFLEHSRIYYFRNGGNPEYYLASADWMPRNLYKRIEIMFPVESTSIRRTIDSILEIQLADRFKARRLLPSGRYTPAGNAKFASSRSQLRTYELFKKG